MWCGSETWCLRENDIVILKRTEKTMIRVMCGVKSMKERAVRNLWNCLVWRKTLDKLVKSNGMRWYKHVLKRHSDDVLRRILKWSRKEKEGNQR